jgi:hypothetical protein
MNVLAGKWGLENGRKCAGSRPIRGALQNRSRGHRHERLLRHSIGDSQSGHCTPKKMMYAFLLLPPAVDGVGSCACKIKHRVGLGPAPILLAVVFFLTAEETSLLDCCRMYISAAVQTYASENGQVESGYSVGQAPLYSGQPFLTCCVDRAPRVPHAVHPIFKNASV